MANWGEALKTLGQGLGAIAVRRMDREERDLEAMRREALAKLQMQHAEKLQDDDQQARLDLFEKQTTASERAAADERSWRTEESRKERAAADARTRLQLSAAEKAELRKAREDVRGNYTRLMQSAASQMKELQNSYLELKAQGTLTPEGEALYQAQIGALMKERDDLQRSMVFDLQRVESGGYGKGLTADEVRAQMASGAAEGQGAKPPRDDSLFGEPSQPAPGSPAAPGSPPPGAYAGQPRQPAPAAAAPAAPAAPVARPELFEQVPSLADAPQPAPAAPPPVAAPQPAAAPSPIQQHAAGRQNAAARALQMIRAGQQVDPLTMGEARRVGMSGLRQAGWTPQDLQLIGY